MTNNYYWIKLGVNFFNIPQIKILNVLQDGAYYIILYIRLLLMSVNQEGNIAMNLDRPYSEEELSAITDINIDKVHNGLDKLADLKLIELLENKSIKVNDYAMFVGPESAEARTAANAERKRRSRANKKQAESRDSHETTSLEIEKELDTYIDIIKKEPLFLKSPDLEKAFFNYLQIRLENNFDTDIKTLKQIIAKLNTLSDGNADKAICIVNKSIANKWKNFFSVDAEAKKSNKRVHDFPERTYDYKALEEEAYAQKPTSEQ